jgi:hypothetical protein
VLFTQEIITRAGRKRVALVIPVGDLAGLLRQVIAPGN